LGSLCAFNLELEAYLAATWPPPPGHPLLLPTPQHASCGFHFFMGKQLNASWRLKSAALVKDNRTVVFNWLRPINSSGADASFSLRVQNALASAYGAVKVQQLVFEGPRGGAWRRAFD